ncbi:MAG: ABC transporter ATP-binding protein [Candidatus Ranarchaeia archaeon]
MSVVFKDTSFRYKHGETKALSNINLEIKPGTNVGVIGQVGAGKSSLLRTLNGLIPIEFPGILEGDVIVDGLNTKEHEVKDLARRVGIVLDNPATQIFALTVEDDVNFGPTNIGLPEDVRAKSVEFALKETRLAPLRRRNPEELSGGQQQALAIAGILAMRPKIFGMDEPLAMLDPVGKNHVLSLIKKVTKDYKVTSIIAESGVDLEYLIGYMNRVIILDHGHIVIDDIPEKALISDLLEDAGIGYPEVIDLFLRLRQKNPEIPTPISLDAAVEYLTDALKSNQIERKKSLIKVPLAITAETQPVPSDPPIISVRNLRYTYEGGVQALRGVSFDIFEGEMVGLIGQNGSGKTTLAFNMVGLYKSDDPESKVYVKGMDVKTHSTRQITQHINYVFQNPDDQLFCPTVWDEVAYGPKILGWDEETIVKKGWKAIKLFDLDEYVNTNILFLTRDLRTFTAISSVISLDPQILIIDEPTTGMDRKSAEKVMEVLHQLKNQGHTVIVITHSMRLVAEHCDRTIVLKDGRILLDGPTRKVFASPEILAKAYLSPPQTSQLAQRLRDIGLTEDILTVKEMYDYLSPLLT